MNIDLKGQVDRLIRIGTALSGERDVNVLLEMIVDESREITYADGGTLFTVNPDVTALDWRIVQNDTMNTRIGGTSELEVDRAIYPPVPLREGLEVNLANVSAYVANTGNTVNIPDVYEAEGFDFTGPRKYDQGTGYRSKSMLVAPMRNHEDDIIGVLQLLNARDRTTGEVIPFSDEFEALITSLASQAAIGMTNAQLIMDLQALFDSFIQSTAAAIDEKSPYTAGHVRRVAQLTMLIAEAINESKDGAWERVQFSQEELTELRIAAWMHDVGKITTPEHVVDKAKKLETIYDRIETVCVRFEVMKREAELDALKCKLDLRSSNEDQEAIETIDRELGDRLQQLDEDREFVKNCNTGGEFMDDADIERLRSIAQLVYRIDGEECPLLTGNEVYNLSIRKGTLTNEEREIINNHAAVSVRMLSQLPFSKTLRRVPEIAGGHHEKLDGKGYPRGLHADQLSLQARVLAVADIFEALTAPDRPYRKPMPFSRALDIIENMVGDSELDRRIVDLFVKSGTAQEYAEKELEATQLE